MSTYVVHEVLVAGIELFLPGLGLLYLARWLWTYHPEGANAPLRLTWHHPGRSAESFAMWLGHKAVEWSWRGLKWTLDVLEEASAEVGDWFLGHRGAGG